MASEAIQAMHRVQPIFMEALNPEEREGLAIAATAHLTAIIQSLLSGYDEESQCIHVEPDAGCIECTVGTVPNNLNTGLCALHNARRVVSESKRQQHDFDGAFGKCKGCGKFVEDVIDEPFCTKATAP